MPDPDLTRSSPYGVTEIFLSVQGEGARAGTLQVFVRFQGCNLRCALPTHGFDCDTNWTSGSPMTLDAVVERCVELWPVEISTGRPALHGIRPGPGEPWVSLTGGEPSLQVDLPLVKALRARGFRLSIDTNGTRELPRWESILGEHLPGEPFDEVSLALEWYPFDWITVSPKSAEHTLRQVVAHEVRYVIGVGMSLPRTQVKAHRFTLSPAFLGEDLDPSAIAECSRLVRQDPRWEISVQAHKLWGVR